MRTQLNSGTGFEIPPLPPRKADNAGFGISLPVPELATNEGEILWRWLNPWLNKYH